MAGAAKYYLVATPKRYSLYQSVRAPRLVESRVLVPAATRDYSPITRRYRRAPCKVELVTTEIQAGKAKLLGEWPSHRNYYNAILAFPKHSKKLEYAHYGPHPLARGNPKEKRSSCMVVTKTEAEHFMNRGIQ